MNITENDDLAGPICRVQKSVDISQDNKSISHRTNVGGIFLIFLGLFLTGFGQTVYFSLSVSYLDDNVSRKNSPLFIGEQHFWENFNTYKLSLNKLRQRDKLFIGPILVF